MGIGKTIGISDDLFLFGGLILLIQVIPIYLIYLCWRVQKSENKMENMNVEIFYVVSVRMSGGIILEDKKVG